VTQDSKPVTVCVSHISVQQQIAVSCSRSAVQFTNCLALDYG